MLLLAWLMDFGPLLPFRACQSMSQLQLGSIGAGGVVVRMLSCRLGARMNLFSLSVRRISSLKVKGFRLLSLELSSLSLGSLVFIILTLMKQMIICLLSSNVQNDRVVGEFKTARFAFLQPEKKLMETLLQ